MTEGNKPPTTTGNLKRPSIPVVKPEWEPIPEEMVETKDDALYEDFLVKVLLKLRMWWTTMISCYM